MSFDLIAAPDGGQEMTNGKIRRLRDSDTFNDPPEKTKFWKWVRKNFQTPNKHFESWIRGTKNISRERVKIFFEEIQNGNRRLKGMPYDVQNEILRNTTCQERNDYCKAIYRELENTQSIDKQTPCTNRMFKELHDAKCEAQKNRGESIPPYPKIMNVLLDHLQASVDGDVKKLRDAELKHLLDSLLTHDYTDDKGKKFFSKRNLGLKPEDEENKWNIILGESAKFGHANVVEVLLAAGCDPTAKRNYAIIAASANGHIAVVQALLAWKRPNSRRVDPTDGRNYAVRKASENGHSAVVEALLAWEGLNDKRVNPTAHDNYAVQFASENGHIAVVQALLAWKGDGDLEGLKVDPTVDRHLDQATPKSVLRIFL